MEYKFSGNIITALQLKDGIEFSLTEGKLRLHILAADLLRVRRRKQNA